MGRSSQSENGCRLNAIVRRASSKMMSSQGTQNTQIEIIHVAAKSQLFLVDRAGAAGIAGAYPIVLEAVTAVMAGVHPGESSEYQAASSFCHCLSSARRSQDLPELPEILTDLINFAKTNTTVSISVVWAERARSMALPAGPARSMCASLQFLNPRSEAFWQRPLRHQCFQSAGSVSHKMSSHHR